MILRYCLDEALPLLGWVAVLDEGNPDELTVTHGQYVETTPSCFFEGAWAGDFTLGLPNQTEVVFGSGAVARAGEVIFVTSLATTDYLFYRQSGKRTVVANSLALLLAAIDDRLDPQFGGYDEVHNSILRGIDEATRLIPTVGGSVSRLMHYNLRVKADALEEISKPESPRFPSFETYQSYLSTSYASLVQNARDPRRRHPLRIYSTQSRGYDSTAVNALAAPHGLDGVFTVTRGKGGGAFADDRNETEADDDGTTIARTLGIETIWQLQRRAYRDDFLDEVYLYASIHEPQDANLKSVIDHLSPPALLLTGTLGELWYPKRLWYDSRPAYLKPDLRRGDLSLHGLTETRIRAGFIQVAIPYIGARRREEIVAVTESSEMSPWRLDNGYDRPIPRRIAESAGIPRSAFGQIKVGSVVEFTPPHIPQRDELRRAYFKFLVESGLRRRWQLELFGLIHRLNRALWFASENQHRWLYYSLRLASRVSGRPAASRLFWNDLRGSMFCFAVNACADEYSSVQSSIEVARGIPNENG